MEGLDNPCRSAEGFLGLAEILVLVARNAVACREAKQSLINDLITGSSPDEHVLEELCSKLTREKLFVAAQCVALRTPSHEGMPALLSALCASGETLLAQELAEKHGLEFSDHDATALVEAFERSDYADKPRGMSVLAVIEKLHSKETASQLRQRVYEKLKPQTARSQRFTSHATTRGRTYGYSGIL